MICDTEPKYQPKPAWLKKRLPRGGEYQRVTRLLNRSRLHTVCQEANCPNLFECFSKHTATFMILGAQCTRNCRFCNITNLDPEPVDEQEPIRVARAAQALGLTYVVVTSVTRDDLSDGGAGQFARTITAIKEIVTDNTLKNSPDTSARVEVLIPDFQGDKAALKTVLDAGPDVLNHNVETVPSLYAKVRPQANYQRSLDLLARARQMTPHIPVKSGIMVGLGETMAQLTDTMADLREHGCEILTIGQYLQPTKAHLPVVTYYAPEQFEILETLARQTGFKKIACGPHVRSSYNAQNLMDETC